MGLAALGILWTVATTPVHGAIAQESATLLVDPATVAPGDVLEVTGGNWPSWPLGAALFDDQGAATAGIATDGLDVVDGQLRGLAEMPAGVPFGAYTLEVCAFEEIEFVQVCASTQVTLAPVVDVVPSAVLPGGQVEVLVRGLAGSSPDPEGEWPLEVWLDTSGLESPRVPLRGVLDGEGLLRSSIAVPLEATWGGAVLRACDTRDCEPVVERPIDVLPAELVLGQAEAATEDSVAVAGIGWCCQGDELAVRDALTGDPWPSAVTVVDDAGALVGSFTVPAGQPPGSTRVEVCDAAGQCTLRPLVIVERAAPSPTTPTPVPTTPVPTAPVPTSSTPATTPLDDDGRASAAWWPWLPLGLAGATAAALWVRRARRRRVGRTPAPGPPPQPVTPRPGSTRPLPPSGVAGPIRLWPRLDLPTAVRAGDPFTGRLRLELSDGTLPNHWSEVDVQLLGDGFEVADGTRFEVAASEASASHAVTLTATDVQVATSAPLVAWVFWEGHLVGWTRAVVEVVPASEPAPAMAGTAPASSVPLGTPDGPAADLTIVVARGRDGTHLVWGLGTAHPVDLPTTTMRRDLGVQSARTFARGLLGIVDVAPRLVPHELDGTTRIIGGQVPSEVWQAIRDVRPFAATLGREPAILLVSEERYVPWELARLPSDLVVDPDLPGLLGAQFTIGRWVPPDPEDGLEPDRPVLPPPTRIGAGSLTVVLHEGGEQPLPFAAQEARGLQASHDARIVGATIDEVEPLLFGTANAGTSILHFACHGRLSVGQPMDGGIILRDADGWATVRPQMLLAARFLREHSPTIFFNACEAGHSESGLDWYSDLVGCAMRAGASAVVAPLWKVLDEPARDAAATFYDAALGDGVTAAEAMRRVRARSIRPDTDPRTPLAYILHAHPLLTLRLGQ